MVCGSLSGHRERAVCDVAEASRDSLVCDRSVPIDCPTLNEMSIKNFAPVAGFSQGDLSRNNKFIYELYIKSLRFSSTR